MKKPVIKKANPFEVHINRQKMTVLGQKGKSDRGLPGVSRAKALKKRKKTLLHEYEQQHKSNKFTDRRLGERNPQMSGEDKVMARYAAVRKKAHKKSIFNLADDEVLTHRGQTLAEIEKFDDPRSDDDGTDDNLDAEFVEEAHFGGGLLKNTQREGAKTHRELIDELIAESKKRKAEQQYTKEATLQLTEKLDTEWKDLQPLVNQSKVKPQKIEKSLDEYDKIMRELRFEARGTVSDKLKTNKEIADEAKERLETFVKKQEERMKDSEIHVRRSHRSADDLDDDFYQPDPEYMLSYNKEGEANVEIIAEINGRKVGEVESEESSAEEDRSSSDDDLSDLKADTESEDDNEEICEKSVKTVLEEEPHEEVETVSMELPNSYNDFKQKLKTIPIEKISSVIQATIKLNHPSLAEDNKTKLRLFFVYILQYLNDSVFDYEFTKCYKIFAELSPSLFDLTQMDKVNSYNSMKELIKEKHDEFKKHPKRVPSLEVLIFFKLVGLLYPTSDFRHQVVTPCLVFMEQILFNCRFSTRSDIAYGLFVVTLMLEYTSLSKRYSAAAVNYLGGLLHMAVPKFGVQLIKVRPPFKPINRSLVLPQACNCDELKLLLNDLNNNEIDDSFKVRVVHNVLNFIGDFHEQLSGLSSVVEIFQDVLVYLELIPMRNYPRFVARKLEDILQMLQLRRKNLQLEYIVMEADKPKALRLYEPKIEEIFDGKRRKFQSKEKAEHDKLLHKLKKETKGALREIRRDKAFLGRVRIQKQIRSDNERREKVKRIFSDAASQQSELNSMDRKKKRK